MAIESGTTFNSLQVIDKLGKGGNCEVFRARDTVSERLVALKILLDSRNVLRFRREFRSMSHLDHLNIAKVYDYGEYEGKAYFTMEFIDGGDLKQFILRSDGNGSDKTRFVPKTQDDFTSLSKLFLQICEPLKYIHSQKIIHRDLKPANIMLTREGVVKLMDFGLIKELDVIQESLTQTGTFVGTVNYMSPEQGLCRNLDHRSDIYSLGIILYEMLSGNLPFSGSSVMEVFMKHIKEEPLPPREFNEAIPPILEQAALFMLQKEPSRRPSTIQEIMQFFERYLNPEPVEVGETIGMILDETIDVESITDELRPALFAPGIIGRDTLIDDFSSMIKDAHLLTPVMLVSGEMGIGKSKLMSEYGMNARLNGFSYYSGSCIEIERFPYGGFLRPLENLADRIRTKPVEDREVLLSGKGPVLAQICPRFSDIPEIRDAPPPPPMEPFQEKLRTFDAIKTVLENSARGKPILLAVDDLHWGDDLSIEFFHYLARNLSMSNGQPGVSIILMGSYRPKEIKPDHPLSKILGHLKKLPNVSAIELAPLDRNYVKQLIEAILEIETGGELLVDLIHRESGGIPFFIEEIIKGLIDQGIINRRRGKWVFDQTKIQDVVPVIDDDTVTTSLIPISDRVKDLISHRLENLDENIKRILARAAVIGGRFEFNVLSNILTEDEDTLLDYLDEALKEEVIEEIPGTGGEMFRFHNQMLRTVLYASLNIRRRNRVHAQVAESIESLYGKSNPEKWDMLAYHYDKSQMVIPAVDYYLKAASRGINTHSLQLTKDYSKRVIDLLHDVELTREQRLKFHLDAFRLHGRSAEITGNLDVAQENYKRIVTLGKEESDATTEALGYYHIGGVEMDYGRLQDALDAYHKCLKILPDTPENIYRKANTMGNIAGVFMDQGQYKESIDLLLKVSDVADKIASKNDREMVMAMFKMNIGRANYYLGNYEDAFKWFNASIDQYRKQNNLFSLSKALNNISVLYMTRGDTEHALQYGLETLEISRKIGDINSIATVQGNLGLCYHATGRLNEAVKSLEESLDIARRLNYQTSATIAMINLAALYTDLGSREYPLKYINEALAIIKETGERWLSAYALNNLGEYYLLMGNLEKAETAISECHEIATSVGLKALELECEANSAWREALHGNYEMAASSGMESLKKAMELGDSDIIIRAHYRNANIYLITGKYTSAKNIAARGLKRAIQTQHTGFQWRFLSVIGQALAYERRYNAAIRSFRHASRILLMMSKHVETAFKEQFFKHPEIFPVFVTFRDIALKLDQKKDVEACRNVLKITGIE